MKSSPLLSLSQSGAEGHRNTHRGTYRVTTLGSDGGLEVMDDREGASRLEQPQALKYDRRKQTRRDMNTGTSRKLT